MGELYRRGSWYFQVFPSFASCLCPMPIFFLRTEPNKYRRGLVWFQVVSTFLDRDPSNIELSLSLETNRWIQPRILVRIARTASWLVPCTLRIESE